jgi:hypothetical protein
MPSTNANGLPYPLPTDPLTDGAVAIKNLADALDGRITSSVPGDSKTPSSPPTAFPQGLSGMTISTAAGASWPIGGAGWLITHVDGPRTRGYQVVYRIGLSMAYIRTALSSAAGWSLWRSAIAPYGVATGATTATGVPATSVKTTAVTFPAGVFGAGGIIAVVATPRTTSPNLRAASTNTVNINGFNLHLYNGGASATDVTAEWVATQNDTVNTTTARADLEADGVTFETVTCPTDGCQNAGVPIDVAVTYLDDDGVLVDVDAVQCGVCGTDLTP